jgi:hypothetical protein
MMDCWHTEIEPKKCYTKVKDMKVKKDKIIVQQFSQNGVTKNRHYDFHISHA